MKTALVLVGFSLLVAGCASTPVALHPLRQVIADYRSIEKGMTEEEVIALLGEPNKADKTGALTLHWWQDNSSNMTFDRYAELDVSFDADGRVVETKLRAGADHYPSVPMTIEPRASNPLSNPGVSGI